MKIIKIISLFFIFSFSVSAAFTEPEMSQLDEINRKSIEKTEKSRSLFDITIQKTLEHLPEERDKIVDLKKSWDATIKKKCRLMIFESMNTDAEIAEGNSCLSEEYTSAADFFEKLNY